MHTKLLLFTVLMLCSIAIAESKGTRVPLHTRLYYDMGNGTNIWFVSYMRCRLHNNEDFTFHRYRTIRKEDKIYYENGGVLSIHGDKMSYLGMTNELTLATMYLMTPTNIVPHGCIWACK